MKQLLLDAAANPYAPGAGVRPPLLAGRDRELDEVHLLLERARVGRVDQPRLVEGVRGVGKTVLLLAARDAGRGEGVPSAHVQARRHEGMVRGLLRELELELRRLSRVVTKIDAALRVLAAVAVTVGGIRVEAEPARGKGDSGDLVLDLLDLFEVVTDACAKPLLISVDEAQQLRDPEASALLVAIQRAAGESLPVVLITAGLPGTLAKLARVESFAERMFRVWTLGPLDPAAAARAVTQPAADAGGVRWDDDAVQRLVGEANGFPFFLQYFAAATWDVATHDPIRVADVRAGLGRAALFLRDEVVRARVVRLSGREREYVAALAALGPGLHGSGDVAEQMGLASNQAAAIRRRLIDAGLIYSPRYGVTGFTLPLFDQLLRANADLLSTAMP